MPEEKTPAELEAEKQALVNADGSAVDNNQQPIKTKEQIVSELSEKYKDLEPAQLLEKVAEELANKDVIISHKNRAIEASKKPKEVTPASTTVTQDDQKTAVEKLVELALGEIRKTTGQEQLVSRVNSLTNDIAERQVIMDAYNNDIIKTGDVEKDLQKALAIANSNFITEIRKNKSEAEVNESILARFVGGNNYASNTDTGPKLSVAQKAAAENLRKLGYSEERIKAAIG